MKEICYCVLCLFVCLFVCLHIYKVAQISQIGLFLLFFSSFFHFVYIRVDNA